MTTGEIMDAGNALWGMIPSPGEPTVAGPGTERKIQVMLERALRREPLFHPLDGLRQKLRQPLPMVSAAAERLESA
jgi:hypothetical protein